jgi:hypothetical protein
MNSKAIQDIFITLSLLSLILGIIIIAGQVSIFYYHIYGLVGLIGTILAYIFLFSTIMVFVIYIRDD